MDKTTACSWRRVAVLGGAGFVGLWSEKSGEPGGGVDFALKKKVLSNNDAKYKLPYCIIQYKALSNGKYIWCLHRVSVNTTSPRLTLAFFLCPKSDKKMKPPQELIDKDGKQEYPDFTWEEFLRFTQKHHRADENTLALFNKWLHSSRSSTA
ncbi:gibberellin 20 oxidase 3-like protein [Tanacetum coccineum]|uniref:Gibberellin 20 oxidase 3-like protein n=1 Tax=Tanacetum coccineum TaxID=301880 RepID=A0ABQ4Z1L5_9ASTR